MPGRVTEAQLERSPVSAEGIELLGFDVGIRQRRAMARSAIVVHDDVAIQRVGVVGQGSHRGGPRETSIRLFGGGDALAVHGRFQGVPGQDGALDARGIRNHTGQHFQIAQQVVV